MVFRHILRSWLQDAARKKVAEAAQNHVHAAPRQESCHLGIVFALGIESGCLEDLLDEVTTVRGEGFVVRQGMLGGRPVAVILAGPGRQNAANATDALIDGHRPEWVLSAGFAGGLTDQLRRRDILMVDRLCDDSGKELSIDLKVDPEGLARRPDVHIGRLLTVDRVIRAPNEKRRLAKEHDAEAVDMETFAVAEVCRRRAVRLLAVRVINDTVDDELPADVERLLAQPTRAAQLGAAVGSMWRRPASFKDMVRLRENALLASDRLAKFIAAMVEQL